MAGVGRKQEVLMKSQCNYRDMLRSKILFAFSAHHKSDEFNGLFHHKWKNVYSDIDETNEACRL